MGRVGDGVTDEEGGGGSDRVSIPDLYKEPSGTGGEEELIDEEATRV